MPELYNRRIVQNFTTNVVRNAVSFFFTRALAGLFLSVSMNSNLISNCFATAVVNPTEKVVSESAKSFVFQMVDRDSVRVAVEESSC